MCLLVHSQRILFFGGGTLCFVVKRLFSTVVKWSTIGGQSLRRLPLELLGRKVTQC
jgi:hypothetical protein